MLVHPEFDPVAISIGPLSVHWYGLMYLIGFGCAWAIGMYQGRREWSPVKPSQVEDMVFYGALGVVIGARFGYVFFYNFDQFLEDPLWLFRLWEGGMSFHGGFLGVLTAMWLYSRKLKQPFLRVMDFLAPMAPAGIFFGRMGNFIGQELWGRETDVSWGMLFPKDPEKLVRHPSQLYEAALEGIVLLIILLWFSRKQRPAGAVAAMFALFYGVFRFAIEFFREPDSHIGFAFDWVTRGQILTIPMIIIGLVFLFGAYLRERQKTH